MKVIVGLGNPGKKYEKNRHNIGHIFIDWMADQIQSSTPKDSSFLPRSTSSRRKGEPTGQEFKAFKTDTFMNNSGQAVKKYVSRFKLQVSSDLLIVHDDLDIKLGEYKIQKGKGPRLHNGIESIEKSLGTTDFWRVRIGVDNRDPEKRIPGEKYVLQDFSQEENIILENLFPKIFQALSNLL